MHVLSVSSLKGGVGKTTVALGLASAALNKGLNTLLVDLDPQCDATSGLAATNEFGASVAEVLQSPKLPAIKRAIVSSSWQRGSKMDVMVGSPRSLLLDNPAPTVSDVWKLEEVLTQIEEDYDLVIIDTPPSINALTRTAWVASDRVIIVTEPSLYSVIAADRARKAIAEISAKLTPRLELLGVVVNRLRPQSNEHDYRLKELKEMFGNQLLMPYFEERAAIQQSTGAARPIHSWPAEGAAEVAKGFDWLLTGALSAMERETRNPDRASSGRATRGMGNPISELLTQPESRKEGKKRRWFSR
ncbi:MAG: ParA family protein [Actinobacteria bacterium]|nr:ParA family protein [Actinomycetota bacterium]